MHFLKLHGAGNDFILLPEPDTGTVTDWPQVARQLCARRTGIGADGLVRATRLADDVFDVVCLNADGSKATMCGNALRCVAWWAATEFGLVRMHIVMADITHRAQFARDGVWVTAHVGAVEPDRLHVEIDHQVWWFDAAHTGTEHLVAVVEDVDEVDVEAVGRRVCHHSDLAPIGANVNFAQVAGPGELRLRTYERGVEAETLSCGSGAVAAAIIAIRRALITESPVIVHNRCGTPLIVRPDPLSPEPMYWVGGPVACTYRGEFA